MMTLTSEMLTGYMSDFFWPFVRILALFSTAPLFSEKQTPKKFRIALAFLITALIAPGLPQNNIPLFSIIAFWVLLQQILIGTLLGLAMQMAFASVRHAGEVIGLQMGLSFATFFDPSGGPNMPILARIFNLLTMLLFMVFDGHLWLLSILVDTFYVVPIENQTFNSLAFLTLVQSASAIFINGMMLAMPLITLLLVLNLSLGILNRMTPQLSVFVVGFPLTLTVGILAMSMIMPALPVFTERVFSDTFNRITLILQQLVS
ncbi:MAG TPA: flagellar type III secretion system protein FliR [Proteus sp.]|uniref:Flagellar biosynthetic protein FliR n=1 Tax=Proteus hauseri ATCC 700826 TaxID=1354271 RepID=A0AAJ3HRA4_PROHU|nr:flagellar biosynthetic protein FliR [Proteus hauseri]OAT46154.1 FliR family flagellar biosynthesis protein [Proteus hauseri ATCC 700826]QAV25113.1 flagellar type III secretion system protein FliR [Proteus hauseri]HCH49993.1 flagellar type III secretion system protein FliR [Proteus sp. (in: enterobacteria)]